MKQVAKVAIAIAKKMKRNGHSVDGKFTEQLALVHDLMKAISFKERDKKSLPKKFQNIHDVVATSIILKKQNEKNLSRAVLSQQFDAVISTTHPIKSMEEMIVYYADKRVAHTKIVSLEERFEEGSKRYGKRNRKIERAIFELEQELSCMVGEDLSRYTARTFANA